MNNLTKGVLAVLITVSAVSLVSAQPAFPHTVHGDNFEVSEGPFSDSGEAYQGTVYAVSNGEQLDSVDVVDGSFEDLLVSGLENGDEFTLYFNQVSSDTSISFEKGKVETVSDVSVKVDELDAVLDPGSSTVEEGEDIKFDASSSSGSTGVTGYSWDFDDGESASGEEVTHSYSEDGEYLVELTVQDEFGNEAYASQTIEVEDPPSSLTVDEETSEPEQKDPEVPETKQFNAEVDPETGQASAQVGQVEENQQVQVNIPDTEEAESTVGQVSFTSSSSSDSVSVSVSDIGTERPEGVESAGTDVQSYQEINIEGVTDEDITDSSINFKVQKSFLEERERPAEDVVMKRYNNQNWQELDTRMDEELDNAYRFEASSTGFSYYAVALTEEPEPTANIQTSSLNVQPTEGTPPFDVTVEATVENTGDAAGSKEIEVMLGDEVVGSETVDLDAGESTTLTFDYRVEEAGSLSFTSGEQSVTVNSSQSGFDMPLTLIVVVIAAILAGAAYYKRDFIEEKVEEFQGNDEEDYSFT